MSTTVSFPGLGIGEFSVDRVAFELFGKPIYWYGVIIMLGIVAAFVHAIIRSKREGFTTDDVLDMGIFTVLFGVLGARLYYVVTTLDTHEYKSFIDVIAVWEGGLAIYGGIIAGCTALVLTAVYKKINPLKVMDAVGPGVMLAQAIGRWGNFMNGEAFGYEVAEESFLYPFRMGLISDYTDTGSTMHYYHPTFLYESLWNIAGFVFICLIYRKKKFNGQMALTYFAWYGFGRMFIEGLRTDSLYVGPFRISQVVGALCFIAGTALMVAGFVLVQKGKLDKWLTVRWTEAVPAEGVAVIEADQDENTASGETIEEDAEETDTQSYEEEAPRSPMDGEDTAADDTDTE
ncbi:MAG: prolipoprotein diacylglyceryl transferase [Clostridia bacterium]|nr:prolipoprotein diacylglyceryl transferase [Clostridia bacterium]